MSKESLEQFVQQIANSEELQARIGEEIDADSLIALGAEHGCEFSADDLTAGAELSDEELDGVTGGLLSVVNNVISLNYSGARFRMVTDQPQNWANPGFSDATGYGGKSSHIHAIPVFRIHRWCADTIYLQIKDGKAGRHSFCRESSMMLEAGK